MTYARQLTQQRGSILPTQHHADQVALLKRTDPETAEPAGVDREVALMVLEELFLLVLVHNAEHDVTRLFR